MKLLFKRAKWSCTSYLLVHFLVLSCCYQTKHFLSSQYLPVIYIYFVLVEWQFVCIQSGKQSFFQYWFFFKWHHELYILSLCTCKPDPFILQSRKLNSRCQHCKLNVQPWKWSFAVSDSSRATKIKCKSSCADRSIRAEEGSLHLCLTAQVGIVAFSSSTVFF